MTSPIDSITQKTPPAICSADLLPLAGIILLSLLVYSPIFFGRPCMPDTWTRFQPWNTVLGYDGPTDERIRNSNNDAILMYIPWDSFAHRELNNGRIPAYDPYCLMGVPLAANHLVPVFYPIYTLIALLVSPLYILGVSALVHTILLGIFFYLFLREWMDSPIAAWAASSLLVISLIPNPHYQPWPMTLAWFPAIWFFYERWLKHRSAWSGLWIALCWAGPLLAGYPSLVAQMSIFTAAWFLIRPVGMELSARRSMKSRLGILLWPFILALGLSAVQNVPTIMASIESDRTFFKSSEELSREAAFTIPPNQPWQIHVKRLLQPLVPFKFPGNDFFNRGYVGLLAVMFAFMSLAYIKRKGYPLYLLYLALLIAPFALIPALNFGLYWLTRGALIDPNPPLEVLGFLILMLSSVGIDYIARKPESLDEPSQIPVLVSQKWSVILAVIVMAAGMFFDARSQGSLVLGEFSIPAFIIVLLLLNYAWGFNDDRKKRIVVVTLMSLVIGMYAYSLGEYLCPSNCMIASNKQTPFGEVESITRLRGITNPLIGGAWGRMIRYHPESVNVMSIDNQPYTFYPNLGTHFEIPDGFGYHNLAPKSRLEYFREIEPDAVVENRGIVAFTPPVDPFDYRLEVIGARYILTVEPIENLVPIYSGEGLMVYENPDAWRRVEFMPESDYDDNSSGDWTQIEPWQSELRLMDPSWPVVALDEPVHIVIESESDYVVKGRLIVNEGYLSGWKGSVDGEHLEIFEVNGILMGLHLPDSWKRVELIYEMPGLLLGWEITILSGLIWVISGFAIVKKGKRPR
jgi:hypothetical protein